MRNVSDIDWLFWGQICNAFSIPWPLLHWVPKAQKPIAALSKKNWIRYKNTLCNQPILSILHSFNSMKKCTHEDLRSFLRSSWVHFRYTILAGLTNCANSKKMATSPWIDHQCASIQQERNRGAGDTQARHGSSYPKDSDPAQIPGKHRPGCSGLCRGSRGCSRNRPLVWDYGPTAPWKG